MRKNSVKIFKNMDDIFIKKIKDDLALVKPDSSWRESRKELLMRQVGAQVVPLAHGDIFSLWLKRYFSAYLNSKTYANLFKPTGVFALIIILILGGGLFSVRAAENSLPGDLFYGVKRTREKLLVNLATSDEKRAQLHVEFAGKRLEELVVLTEQPFDTPKKVDNITVAVTDFKEELVGVGDKLSKFGNGWQEPDTLIAVATMIDAKVAEYSEHLDKTLKKDVSVVDLSKEPMVINSVDEAIKASNDVSNKAVTILINQKDKEGVKDDVREQIKDTVLKKIEKTQESVVAAADVLSKIENNEIPQAVAQKVEADLKMIANVGSEIKDIVSVDQPNGQVGKTVGSGTNSTQSGQQSKDNNGSSDFSLSVSGNPPVIESKKAENLLVEAGILAQKGDLSGALEKVQATQVIVEQIKDLAKNSTQFVEAPKQIDTKLEASVQGKEKNATIEFVPADDSAKNDTLIN